MVVDDNSDMRAYLTRLLSPHWQVETVDSGTKALERVRDHPPDLLVADVMMPGLGGLELLGALRADPATRELPVIVLSARAGEEAAIEGLAAGADDYLAKPFSSRDLIARVRTNLELSRLRRRPLPSCGPSTTASSRPSSSCRSASSSLRRPPDGS